MPKKPARNAFYFFMIDFKEDQRKKGINYKSMAEVAEAAGPLWKNSSRPVRAEYENMAKKEKQKATDSMQKFTSTGIPLAMVQQVEKEAQELEELERKDITSFVNLRAFNNRLLTMYIYLMDVNYYCKGVTDYVIGEMTLLRFNIKDGIKEAYHEMINPGSIPLGYTSEVKLGAKEFGLDMPDETAPCSNYMQILANIVDYLKREDRNDKVLPPIFTMPEKVEAVQNFIHQMCRRAAEDETLFRVYKFDILFFNCMNALKGSANEGFPKESLALTQLTRDPFKYSPGIACKHHERCDQSIECSQSRAKRWAYTALDSCCVAAGVEPRPDTHLPPDFDVDGIHVYREQKRGRLGPSVAGYLQAMSSCNTSVASESFAEISVNSTDSKNTEKRVHVPLRMPKADYSQTIRSAPELTEEEFPSLPPRGGRGRGLGGSFNKLKIGK